MDIIKDIGMGLGALISILLIIAFACSGESEEEKRRKREKEKAEERNKRDILQWINEKIVEYGGGEFAWREQQDLIHKYAIENKRELLNESRSIRSNYNKLHWKQWIEALKEQQPRIYNRTDEVFYYRALEIATRYENSPKDDLTVPRTEISPHINNKVEILTNEYLIYSCRCDVAWLKRYAFDHYQDLVDHEKEIKAEYETFTRNKELTRYLRDKHPKLFNLAIWRMRAFAMIEHYNIRGRRNAEQVRRAILRKVEVAADDFIAKTERAIAKIDELREQLEAAGVDPDIVAARVAELEDQLLGGEGNETDPQNNGRTI